MSDVSALPPAVRAYVYGYYVRGRRLALVRGAGRAAGLFGAWMLVWCGLDRLLQLPAWARLLLLAVGAVAAALVIGRPVGRLLRRRADWVGVAAEIERENPRFGQRLVTITSRLLGRPEHRGSDEILEHLVYEVNREAADENAGRLLPLRGVAGPWLGVLAVVLAFVGLAQMPGLNVPRLAERFVLPLADVPPVTTTHLAVAPGDKDVPQAAPIQIEVQTDHLGDAPVWLYVSDDGGKNFTRSAMNRAAGPATGDGRFTLTLPSVDRDLWYYVAGGDARSSTYAVRVLRPPAVAEFHIRYVYPAYTGKPPFSATNTDGKIEAPVGTEAFVTFRSTEPLQSALLSVGGEKVLTARAGADDLRQFRLTVLKDLKYELDLISTREQHGTGPSSAAVHMLPDRSPLVRIVQPSDDLRLSPQDVLPIAYEAMDDFALDAVFVRAQVGSAPFIEVPVETFGSGGGDRPAESPAEGAGPSEPRTRRREGVFHLDLATIPTAVGDVVSIALAARDSGGNTTVGEPIHVLVSPRSVDLDTYERVGELEAAVQLCDAAANELYVVQSALNEALADGGEKADKVGKGGGPPVARVSRRLSAAAEAASAAKRSLLRATARGAGPDLAVALAGWTDRVQVVAAAAQAAFRAGVGPASSKAERDWAADVVGQALHSAREAEGGLKTIAQGERAAALLADRENLAAAARRPTAADGKDPKAAEAARKTIQRTRDEVAEGAKRLGLNPGASDLDQQLKAKVEAGRNAVRATKPLDFAAAARDWSQAFQKESARRMKDGKAGKSEKEIKEANGQSAQKEQKDRPRPRVPAALAALDERLAAAAQAEAVRRDADLSRARDLHLAARAAAVLESAATGPRPAGGGPPAVGAGALNEYASAVAALQREHEMNRQGEQAAAVRRPDEVDHVRTAAARARTVMAKLAGDADVVATAAPQSGPAVSSGMPSAVPAPAIGTFAPAASAALTRSARAEALAMQASAEAAARNYRTADQFDQGLRRQLTAMAAAPAGPAAAAGTSPAATTTSEAGADFQQQAADVDRTQQGVARLMEAAEKIDGVAAAQQKVADETRAAEEGKAADAAVAALASRQEYVARQLAESGRRINPLAGPGVVSLSGGGVSPGGSPPGGPPPVGGPADDPNWRERATTAIVATQSQLAAVPQQVAALQEAAAAARDAAKRAAEAKRQADAAGPDAKEAAGRAAEQAAKDAKEAADRLDAAAKPVGPQAADALAIGLEPYAPDATAARDALGLQLSPALKALRDATKANDPAAVDRAAADARQAVEAAQRQLSGAEDALAERDPLVAAKSFARAAADALNRKPPDFPTARRYQKGTAAALSRAWDLSIHRAAGLRFAAVPTLRPLVIPAPPPDPRSPEAPRTAAARDWRRLRPQADDPAGGAGREAAPPEYEAALELYFKAINKARDGKP